MGRTDGARANSSATAERTLGNAGQPLLALDYEPQSLKRAVRFGLCVWAFMTLFFLRRYRLTFDMDDDKQPLTLFSENAHYYSFYLDVVRAPSSIQAVEALVHDRRSEHPDVINALERFNVYPELALGLLYRGLRAIMGHTLEDWFRTPFNFYAGCIFCFQALGVACLCVLASHIGSSVLCGICCLGFFLGNFYHRLILRTDALALREHWGLPFLWMNVIAIYVMLQRHMRVRDQAKVFGPLITAVLTTIGLLLAWQFGVFILTTQVAALFGMCLLGYPVSIVIRRICAFYLISLVAVFILMFAPKYLAFSFFPHVALSVLLSLWWLPRNASRQGSFVGWMLSVDFRRGLAAVALCGLIRCALIPFEKDDAHVFSILMHHLGFSKDTFDSTIYFLGQTEFLPLNSTLASHIRSSGVLLVAGLMALMVIGFLAREMFLVHRLSCSNWDLFMQFDEGLAPYSCAEDCRKHAVDSAEVKEHKDQSAERRKLESLVGEGLRLRKPAKTTAENAKAEIVSDREDLQKESDRRIISSLSPGFCYLFLQALFFTAMMLLIARLRVLALPLLCLFASLLASKSFWRVSAGRLFSATGLKIDSTRFVSRRTQRLLMYVALLVLNGFSLLPFFIKLPLQELLTTYPALENASNLSKQRLFEWLRLNVPPGAGIMGDMTTSALMRAALPSVRIVVHPQYENVGIRRRVQFSYGVAACPPMALYNQQLRDVYKVDYLVQNSYRCAVPPNSTLSVFDVADKIDAFQFQCPPGVSREQRFCFRTLFDNNRFFDLLYVNEVYSVFKRVDRPDLDLQAFSTKGNPREYLSFNWKENIMSTSSWKPFLERCRRTDPHCGANLAGLGMRMLERHRLQDVATFLHSLAIEEFSDVDTIEQYALYLDFNLHKPEAAEKYYRMAMSKQPPTLARAVQYALYLQESKNGGDDYVEAANEVVNALKASKLSTAELLEEEDNICRGAVLLQQLASNTRYNIPSDKRAQFTEAAHALWQLAKDTNIQNGCVVRHWSLFEGESLSTAKRIIHFFIGNIQRRRHG